MKTIYLTKKYDCERLLGTFLDDSHYDLLAEEDMDIYKPLSGFETEHGEHNILMKFRKNVFPKDVTDNAYIGLNEAATQSQNRGIAAGPKLDKLQNRDWVTELQIEILETLLQDSGSVFGDDLVESVFIKHEANPCRQSNRGLVWLTSKKPKDFDFKEWALATRELPKEERKKETEKVFAWVSDTNYANPVNSGIAGFYDRYPRIPYCRMTSYTANHFDKFQMAIPFIEGVSDQFLGLIPTRWANQRKAIEAMKDSNNFRVGNSVYTTITVNKNYRTAAHRDAGDLPEGFGNLTVVSNGIPWSGGYLIFPEYRVAVNVQPGDMLAMDVHEIHGNTEMFSESGNHERISVVCYFRQNMATCDTKVYEETRFQFVESRRLNKEHPEWRFGWNGISPSMWSSLEWENYLLSQGLKEYADKVRLERDGSLTMLDI